MKENFEKVIEEFKRRTEKECYGIDLAESEPSILDNKIGGKPYLPLGEDYPKDSKGNYMPLLLQINLKDIDLEDYPKEGILEIFTDKDANYPCEYEVRYYKEGLEYQTDLPKIDTTYYIVDNSYKINLEKTVSYMSCTDYRFSQTVCEIVNDLYNKNFSDEQDLDNYYEDFDWQEQIYEKISSPLCLIGGYPEFIQLDPRCDRVENKDECLFKLDSYLNLEKICIGDGGIIFALISKEDIKNCNFKNAYVDWDCF